MNFELNYPNTGLAKDLEQKVQMLEDYCARLRKELEHFLYNLDEENINDFAKIKTAQIEHLIVGSNVQIGTAQDAAGVTTIIGGTVTTEFINALEIHAGSVDAEDITGTYITGKTIRTAVPNNARIELSGSGLTSYNASNQKSGVCLDTASVYSKVEFFHAGFLIGSIGLSGSGSFNVIGTLDCSNADFEFLYDGTSYYATQAWCNEKFSLSGHSHSYATSSDISAAISAHEAAMH